MKTKYGLLDALATGWLLVCVFIIFPVLFIVGSAPNNLNKDFTIQFGLCLAPSIIWFAYSGYKHGQYKEISQTRWPVILLAVLVLGIWLFNFGYLPIRI